ncbi:MAG TPA: hypothetical protein VE954_15290 [Oligoflexus sp.]|uniref:hypothetical protein n=1 Tax=Oligoflexus sp. TaxID=1971216 RepID=UPI002D696202|nr:hypothetical protein [Oligoflexus sp.]HYX34468.1 hypothetical protein [Oligoflexus sp.]
MYKFIILTGVVMGLVWGVYHFNRADETDGPEKELAVAEKRQSYENNEIASELSEPKPEDRENRIQDSAAADHGSAAPSGSSHEAMTPAGQGTEEEPQPLSTPSPHPNEMDNKALPTLEDPELNWTTARPLTSPELVEELSGTYRGSIILITGETIPAEYSLQGEIREAAFTGRQSMNIERPNGMTDTFVRSGKLDFIRLMPDGNSILFDDGVPFKGNSAGRIFQMKASGARLIGKYYVRDSRTEKWNLKGSISLSKE